MASSTGPTIGTTTKVISMKSRMKPSRKITSITTQNAPSTPPGSWANMSSISTSPPKPRNTRENSEAPIRIRNTMALISAVPKATSLSWVKFSLRLLRASSMAPTAPSAAASVGVA
ncbi:hypothetical protein D9M71_127210 [compost metagenome]